MTFKVKLLIRKTIYGGGRHPTLRLQSNVLLHGEHLDSMIAEIEILNGLGRSATIARTEKHFVRFLLTNYGEGKYTIVRCDGRFKSFFNAFIENDRWFRVKGSIAPYLKSEITRQWHPIKDENSNSDK